MKTPLAERFERHVSPEPNTGCWLWTGNVLDHRDPKRMYGVLRRGSKDDGMILAHRASWEIHHGPIPAGKDMRLKGRYRGSTVGLQAAAAEKRSRTHCKRSHALSGDNLIPSALRAGRRDCKLCAVERRQ